MALQNLWQAPRLAPTFHTQGHSWYVGQEVVWDRHQWRYYGGEGEPPRTALSREWRGRGASVSLCRISSLCVSLLRFGLLKLTHTYTQTDRQSDRQTDSFWPAIRSASRSKIVPYTNFEFCPYIYCSPKVAPTLLAPILPHWHSSSDYIDHKKPAK